MARNRSTMRYRRRKSAKFKDGRANPNKALDKCEWSTVAFLCAMKTANKLSQAYVDKAFKAVCDKYVWDTASLLFLSNSKILSQGAIKYGQTKANECDTFLLSYPHEIFDRRDIFPGTLDLPGGP